MTTRLLPRDEWDRLRGTDLGMASSQLPPNTRVMVVEDGSEMVGCLALLPLTHCEGLYIAPAHRKRGRVLRRLLQALGREAQALSVPIVFPASTSAPMTDLIMGLGGIEIPARFFALNVEQAKACQSPQS